jgi:MYXO-CTERM domain-containing protein
VIPESPINVLLPMGAAAVLGLGAVITLRRRRGSVTPA